MLNEEVEKKFPGLYYNTERKQYIMQRDDLEEKLKMCIFAPFF